MLFSSIYPLLGNVCLAVLPTWLRPEAPNGEVGRGARIQAPAARSTGYLDGLRGLVAILVFVRHFSLPWQEKLDYGYGYEGQYYGVLRLPVLRLLYAGPLVPVFFIVSGYVLSAKAVKLAHRRSYDEIAVSLASSTFRRGIRLFLPPVISSLLVVVSVRLGLFSFDYSAMPETGRIPVRPRRLDTTGAQLMQWMGFVADELVNPWRWDVPRLEYGPHLWTIPVSFKGSMVVFLASLMLLRTRPNIRLGLVTASIAYALSRGRWDMAPFLCGRLLCELDFRQNTNRVASQDDNLDPDFLSPVVRKKTRRSIIIIPRGIARKLRGLFSRALVHVSLLLGMYIGSFPRHNNGTRADCVQGYQTMCWLTPNYRHWQAVGAFAIMWAISREKVLRRPLECRLAQYLGRISFSVYLVHEPLLHVFGFFTVPFFRIALAGDSGSTFLSQLGFGLAMAVTGFVLVWVADVFRSVVEEPIGRLAAQVEVLCSVVATPGPG